MTMSFTYPACVKLILEHPVCLAWVLSALYVYIHQCIGRDLWFKSKSLWIFYWIQVMKTELQFLCHSEFVSCASVSILVIYYAVGLWGLYSYILCSFLLCFWLCVRPGGFLNIQLRFCTSTVQFNFGCLILLFVNWSIGWNNVVTYIWQNWQEQKKSVLCDV